MTFRMDASVKRARAQASATRGFIKHPRLSGSGQNRANCDFIMLLTLTPALCECGIPKTGEKLNKMAVNGERHDGPGSWPAQSISALAPLSYQWKIKNRTKLQSGWAAELFTDLLINQVRRDDHCPVGSLFHCLCLHTIKRSNVTCWRVQAYAFGIG